MTDRERILALREGYAAACVHTGSHSSVAHTLAASQYPLTKVKRPREVGGWRCFPRAGHSWMLQLTGTDMLSLTDADRLAIAKVCAEPLEEVEG